MNVDEPPPIFLLASERSGTNLLRKLFSQHQDIYFGPSPAHFLKWLYYRTRVYGCLNNDKNLQQLVKDAIDLCMVHFSPWEMDMDPRAIADDIRKTIPKPNVVLVAHFLQLMYARHSGYQAYFCKDNNLFDFPYLILQEIPSAKFIFLHRDPRDVVLSQKKRTLQSSNLALLSQLWRDEQKKCIATWTFLGPERCFRLSYEDLITNTESVLVTLCQFAGCKYSEKANAEYKASSGVAEEWKHLDLPVITTNHGKYRKELRGNELRIIEAVCGPPMAALGYETITTGKASRLDFHLNRLASGFARIRKQFKRMDEQSQWHASRNRLLTRLSMYSDQ